jgi:hypothetical protein
MVAVELKSLPRYEAAVKRPNSGPVMAMPFRSVVVILTELPCSMKEIDAALAWLGHSKTHTIIRRDLAICPLVIEPPRPEEGIFGARVIDVESPRPHRPAVKPI